MAVDVIGLCTVGALLITPTRELAVQIDQVISHFIKHLDDRFTRMLFIGGNNPAMDVEKAHIITATPGRLVDMFNRNELGFNLLAGVKALEVLILDEADRLLDMGFKASLNTIFSYLPKQRHTGLFSATQTREVEDLIRAGLRNPVHVAVKERATDDNVAEQKTPLTLNNLYLVFEADEKLNHLVTILQSHRDEKHLEYNESYVV